MRYLSHDGGSSLWARIKRLVGRRGRQSSRPWQPAPEWLALMEAAGAAPGSTLVGVVGVGQSVAASSVIVELIAIEIRELGAILSWRARSAEDRLTFGAQVSMTDQFDTVYRLADTRGGGGGGRWDGETVVMPRPPGGARLHVAVASLGPSPDGPPPPPHWDASRVDGPWLFDVQVPSDIG